MNLHVLFFSSSTHPLLILFPSFTWLCAQHRKNDDDEGEAEKNVVVEICKKPLRMWKFERTSESLDFVTFFIRENDELFKINRGKMCWNSQGHWMTLNAITKSSKYFQKFWAFIIIFSSRLQGRFTTLGIFWDFIFQCLNGQLTIDNSMSAEHR